MQKYNPPISSRDTDELIAIAHGSTDNWQQDAIDQAIEELEKRGITKEYQNRILDKWKAQDEKLQLAYQKQLEQNAIEGYSKGKMIYIFLVAPFILIGKWTVDLSLRELKRENYKKKFKQRLFLLLGGPIFWVLLLVANSNENETKRQEEIDNIDISAWKKDRYGNDSLETNKSDIQKNK